MLRVNLYHRISLDLTLRFKKSMNRGWRQILWRGWLVEAYISPYFFAISLPHIPAGYGTSSVFPMMGHPGTTLGSLYFLLKRHVETTWFKMRERRIASTEYPTESIAMSGKIANWLAQWERFSKNSGRPYYWRKSDFNKVLEFDEQPLPWGRYGGAAWRRGLAGFPCGVMPGKSKTTPPRCRLGASIGGRTSLLTQSRGMEAVSQENQKYNFLFGFNLLYKELLELNTFIILLSE